MEITKNAFSEWFKSSNAQIAGNAMRVQWMALLENNNPFFCEDELWSANGKLAAEGLCLAVRKKPVLVQKVIKMLEQRLAEEKTLPFEIWPELMNLATYLLENQDKKMAVHDFVAKQHFDDQELNQMIASAFRCVDKMPEWQGVALLWIMLVKSDVNFCIIVQKFLTEWGRLDEYSNALVIAAFDKLLPEWAPLMIEALTNVPGPYRFDLSLCLFKKYFDEQPQEVTKAVVKCFDKDSDVCLQQKLLDGIFNFLNSKDKPVMLSVALIFLEGVKNFLVDHWADNCFKFGNFWDKLHYAPEVFDIIRGALKNDWNFVAFVKGSEDPLAKLKTPMHMLCYLPVVSRADLCILLLRAVSDGTSEAKNLACRILMEKEDFLQFVESFDEYQDKLEKIWMRSHPISYEISLFSGAITNALVKYGPEVKSVAKLYDFVQGRGLKVPALEERYGKQVEELLRQRSYEKEVLDYLLKH